MYGLSLNYSKEKYAYLVHVNGHKIINQNNIHYLTFTVVGWLDIFTRKDYKDIIIESMIYCIKHKGLNVHAYVIMSNHIHLILSASTGNSLSNIVRDFKKHTSKKIVKTIVENPKESRSEWMLGLFNPNYAFLYSNA